MFESQIARGAKLFDEKAGGVMPADWRGRIDKSALDMSDPCKCIVGQLVGPSYMAALQDLGIDDYQACEFGLDVLYPGGDDPEDDYDLLSREWLDGPLAEDGP